MNDDFKDFMETVKIDIQSKKFIKKNTILLKTLKR